MIAEHFDRNIGITEVLRNELLGAFGDTTRRIGTLAAGLAR